MKAITFISSIIIFSLSFLCASISLAHTKQEKLQAPLFDNLGKIHFPISTQQPLAQRFFDQGMIFYYGFEWGESTRSFKEAARLDPNCAICYWGIALSIGSKINAPTSGTEYKDAKNAIQNALQRINTATPLEQAFIQALALRFQHEPKKTRPATKSISCHSANTNEDVSSKAEITNYANAMYKVTEKYNTNNNAKALYVYAMFDVIEWKFWDENKKIHSSTPKLIQTLQSILSNDKYHIGGNHYYVHIIEQSPNPIQGLTVSNQLKTLVPGSEHLVHMPTHIYFLTGLYHKATESNEEAIKVFKTYNKTCRDQGFEPEINYLWLHNFDYLRTTAMMEGRKQLALSAVNEMIQEPFPTWLAKESSLQWFIPIPYFVKARFGMWNDILKESQPKQQYHYALGMWHYARGMAYSHLNNKEKAMNESAALNKIINLGASKKSLEENGINLLKIANLVLKATIADKNNEQQAAINYLKTADKIQHDMGYHEPPDWYFPVKEALGNAYLKWGQPKLAVAMYQADLDQYPKNGWALYGLAKALKQLGKENEANQVNQSFEEAWKYADIPVPITMKSKE